MSELKVVYEDFSIIIFDKPQGIPSALGKEDSFCEYVFNEYPELKFVKGYKKGEGGLLNRLDNDTGGLLLFAKNDEAFSYYSKLMKENLVTKRYIAIVNGVVSVKSGVISYKIAHHKKNKKKMIAVYEKEKVEFRGREKDAQTEWQLIKVSNNKSILDVKIKEGRRHQIRVHLASIGHSIVGDKLYSKEVSDEKYHLLYCYEVTFKGIDNTTHTVKTEVPFLNKFI